MELELINILCILLFLKFSLSTYVNTKELTIESRSESAGLYDNVYRYAEYAAIAYCLRDNSLTLGRLQNSCPDTLCLISTRESYIEKIYIGLVSAVVFRDVDAGEIIISIKGTTTTNEWILNFTFIFAEYSDKCEGCFVHKGFNEGTKTIKSNIYDKVIELSEQNPLYKIVIIGHSLGGGIAPLLANEFLMQGKDIVVSTYGSPKIGNLKFSEWMNKMWTNNDSKYYYRMTHKNDPVPYLPFQQMGYYHAGINLHFDKDTLPMEEHELIVDDQRFISLFNSDESFNETINAAAMSNKILSHSNYMLLMQCSAKKG